MRRIISAIKRAMGREEEVLNVKICIFWLLVCAQGSD
jgi:hypothetical protein